MSRSRSPKKPGWIYLEREFKQHLAPVGHLITYAREHNVKLFLKDVKWIVHQALDARPFKASDLPDTVDGEHREEVTRLLNDIVAHYDRERKKQERKQRKIEEERKQIPDAEVDRLSYIFNHYGPYLRSDDKRQARLSSTTSISNWLKMTDSEREYWFLRVEAYAKHLKSADTRRYYDKRSRREEYRHFNRNRDYYMGILRIAHKRTEAYITLGLPLEASQEEIKKAWKQLVLEHHPDRGGDPQRFIEINDAYRTIVG